MALKAMENSHCCGKKRFAGMNLNLVFQMNEPRIFKNAFRSWRDFNSDWKAKLPVDNLEDLI